MPDNFDENMSIDEINELFEDVIEMPEMEHIAYRSVADCKISGGSAGAI